MTEAKGGVPVSQPLASPRGVLYAPRRASPVYIEEPDPVFIADYEQTNAAALPVTSTKPSNKNWVIPVVLFLLGLAIVAMLLLLFYHALAAPYKCDSSTGKCSRLWLPPGKNQTTFKSLELCQSSACTE